MMLQQELPKDFASLAGWFRNAIAKGHNQSTINTATGHAVRGILFPGSTHEVLITSSNIHGFNPSCPSRILVALSRASKLERELKNTSGRKIEFIHLNWDLLAPARETKNEGGGDHVDFGVRTNSECVRVPVFKGDAFYPHQRLASINPDGINELNGDLRRRAERFLELTGATTATIERYMQEGPALILARNLGVFPEHHHVVRISEWIPRVADALLWMSHNQPGALYEFARNTPIARELPAEHCDTAKYKSVFINRGDLTANVAAVVAGMKRGTHTFSHQLFIFLHGVAGILHYGNIYDYRYQNPRAQPEERVPHDYARGFSPDYRNGCPIVKWQIPKNGAADERVACLASLDLLHFPVDEYVGIINDVSSAGIPMSERPLVLA